MNQTLYIVVPCYNEEHVLHETSARLLGIVNGLMLIKKISAKSRILFVDDGSKDGTWEIIKNLHMTNHIFSGLRLSRNRGHQNALLAGLMAVKEYADMTITLDADLQDDPSVIEKFVDEFANGSDIVYGVRSCRKSDSFFKRVTAKCFYSLMRALGADIIDNHADYRLMSRRSLEALGAFKESNLFLRGLVPLIGFKSSAVEYTRAERFSGKSKYPFKRMLALALDGVTSFSIRPIRIIAVLGAAIIFISVAALICLFIMSLTGRGLGQAVLAASIWLIGGIQLLGLGVVGEYVGKIYQEIKGRPRYIIETLLDE